MNHTGSPPTESGRVAAPADVPAGAADSVIRIRGARAHNLQDIDLDIPRDKFVVITGPSGSGKSSLAIDTLFAEGQRQFVESLSTHARQFIEQMERADVESLEGLEPTVCIDQRPPPPNPRSTVATVTEIYDYLRLLYARTAEIACYDCGAPIRQQSVEQIRDRLARLPERTKVAVLAPLARGRRGKLADVLARVRKAGLIRVRIDGETHELEHAPELNPRARHDIDAVVDRIIIRPDLGPRLTESIQLAVDLGEGAAAASIREPEAADWRDEVFSTRYACPQCGIDYQEIEPRTFSFNSPYGACPACEGLGRRTAFDAQLVLPDRERSLDDGAIAPWRGLTAKRRATLLGQLEPLLAAARIPTDKPLDQLPAGKLKTLLAGKDKARPGLLTLLEKEYATATKAARRQQLEAFRGETPCPECGGARLRPEARAARLAGRPIHEATALPVADARDFFASLNLAGPHAKIGRPILEEIEQRLAFLEKVGLDYLTLDRATDTLSGGELQRVRLASGIGSGLVGVCYVLDEPSIGLHPRDNDRLIAALRQLQAAGNTVVVVEHDEAIMRACDYLIDIGPGAGRQGGRIVDQGPPREFCERRKAITARYLTGELEIPMPRRRRRPAKTNSLILEGATANNLRGERVAIPLGCLVCVAGVSGSGKSTLINDTLVRAVTQRLGGAAGRPGAYTSLRNVAKIDKIVPVDQSPIGRSPRSNAATYCGAFDEIRKLFAKTRMARQRGYGAGRFSFNTKGGRCETCQGQGLQKIEMNFLPDLYVTCPECEGARFNAATLDVKFRDRSIADVLAMPAGEALEFFANVDVLCRPLQSLVDMGLGYLPLGQPSTTLSGGEAQRVRLATELARGGAGHTLYVLDEPTTGLHFDDIRRLLSVLEQLVEAGNTVLVIEHHLDVIKTADWVIDLGPEGGQGGGRVVAAGTPEEIAQCDQSHTGRFLKDVLG